ncbi:cytochrome P450 [Elsinoe ampelina]|uniref:Cytochrome P450 n=1 Tax=Elsinoe ampelina TaxID=302913 RepID=A0A6A6FZI4_9PEZI|nr:cytochrome P450 [Elsinoe ampelina]
MENKDASSYTAVWVLAFAVTVTIALLWTTFLSPLRHIPGPIFARYTNLWRLYHTWRGRPDIIHNELHEQYGSAVRIGPNCVSLSDPALIRTVFCTWKKDNMFTKSNFYSVADFPMDGKYYPTTFSVRDEQLHTAMTRQANKLYTIPALVKFEPLMDSAIELFIQRLREEFVRPQKPCPIHEWLHFLAWDMIAEITFSRKFGFLEQGEDVQNLIRMGEESTNYLAVVGQMHWLDRLLSKNPIISIGPPSSADSAAFAASQLQARRSGKDRHDIGRPDFLDEFLKLQEEDSTVTDAAVMAWMLSNVIAGSDTTAIELQSIVFFLSKNHGARRKLQDELDSADLGPIPQWKDVSKLPYLDAVVSEAMRCHPVVGILWERVVPQKGMTLSDGRFIPGGTIVGLNPRVVHRDREAFGDDVDEFRPERWLQDHDRSEPLDAYEARARKMRDASMPFGWGKRGCSGRNVATIEMRKVAAALYSNFDVQLINTKKTFDRTAKFFFFHKDMDVIINERSRGRRDSGPAET